MDLRFGPSSGPVAVGLAVAGLGGGEHPAARQHCLTKQGSPEPSYHPKADLALGGWPRLPVLVYRTPKITSW
jgi:hypothetical protein